MASSVRVATVDKILKTLSGANRSLKEIKKVDPKLRYVALFPDSSAAYSGMAFHLLNNPVCEKLIFDSSQIVRKDVMKLCIGDSRNDLDVSLENRNIATFVTSHATITKLGLQEPNIVKLCKGVGGFGLGIINCLVFSKSMSFENGIDLAQRIGQAMDKAAQIVPGERIKINLRPATQIHKVCRAAREHCIKLGIAEEIAVCAVTRKFGPHIIEISGHSEAISFLENRGQDLFEFRWLSRYKTKQHAFHSPLMQPASRFISKYIEDRLAKDPDYIQEPRESSVYSSLSGARLRWVTEVERDLKNYATNPILDEQLCNVMFQRPKTLAQPNIIVMWDKRLLKNLSFINRKAWGSAKLIR